MDSNINKLDNLFSKILQDSHDQYQQWLLSAAGSPEDRDVEPTTDKVQPENDHFSGSRESSPRRFE